MNEQIIQQLIKLQVDYEQSWDEFILKNNEFAQFKHEYQAYYQPLIKEIFPEISKHLNVVKEQNITHYFKYVKTEWVSFCSQYIKKNEMVGSQFLNKLSQDLIVDFSRLLNSYTKTNSDHLKHHFLNQFFTNKANSITILIKNNPELGIRTIAKLKSPQLQFALINQHNEIKDALKDFFSNCSKMEAYYILGQYCEYPNDIPVNKYYKRWIGGEFIHIKFCKLILDDKYENSKYFIRQKNELNKT